MGNHPTGACRIRRKTLLTLAAAMVLVASLLAAVAPQVVAQSGAGRAPAGQSPTAQPPATQPSKVPDWQIAAGGKMEFDIASVKQDTAAVNEQTVNSNIPLGPMDLFTPTGGLLSATNFPLIQYVVFAYKLTSNQAQTVRSQLPKWANTSRYDIEARAGANTTKDQFRLMVQALLADRFKLVVHFDTKQLPVLAMVLDKPITFHNPHKAAARYAVVLASMPYPLPFRRSHGEQRPSLYP